VLRKGEYIGRVKRLKGKSAMLKPTNSGDFVIVEFEDKAINREYTGCRFRTDEFKITENFDT
jgi:hypothetical protein